MIQHRIWQKKPAKRNGFTVKGFDEPDTVLYHYPHQYSEDAVKKRSSVFRKLDFRTTKACASFIAGTFFLARRNRNLMDDRS